MKKVVIVFFVALAILLLALFGVKHFLFPKDGAGVGDVGENHGQTSQVDPADDLQKAQEDEPVKIDSDNPIKSYSNGIATLTYDSSQVYFSEIPTDKDNGIPGTIFMPVSWNEDGEPVYSSNPLPQVEILPLEEVSVTGEGSENFYNITESEWQEFAKALISQMCYTTAELNSGVQINLRNPAVKIDGTTARLYVAFTTACEGGLNLSGSVRLVAKDTNAVVLLALTESGKGLPTALNDAYLSAEISG